jgi:hypothetical protein
MDQVADTIFGSRLSFEAWLFTKAIFQQMEELGRNGPK